MPNQQPKPEPMPTPTPADDPEPIPGDPQPAPDQQIHDPPVFPDQDGRNSLSADLNRQWRKIQQQLDEALADSFPASDPVSIVTSQEEEDWGEGEGLQAGAQLPAGAASPAAATSPGVSPAEPSKEP